MFPNWNDPRLYNPDLYKTWSNDPSTGEKSSSHQQEQTPPSIPPTEADSPGYSSSQHRPQAYGSPETSLQHSNSTASEDSSSPPSRKSNRQSAWPTVSKIVRTFSKKGPGKKSRGKVSSSSHNAFSMHSLQEALPPQPASPPRSDYAMHCRGDFNQASQSGLTSRAIYDQMLRVLARLQEGQTLNAALSDLHADAAIHFNVGSGAGEKRGLHSRGRKLVREYGGDAVLQQFEQAFALPSAWPTRRSNSGPSEQAIYNDMRRVLARLQEGQTLKAALSDLPADVAFRFFGKSSKYKKRGLSDSGRELVREYGGDAVLQQFEQAFALPSAWYTQRSNSSPSEQAIYNDMMRVLARLQEGQTLKAALSDLHADTAIHFNVRSGSGGERGLHSRGRKLVREYGGDAVLQQFEQAFALPSVVPIRGSNSGLSEQAIYNDMMRVLARLQEGQTFEAALRGLDVGAGLYFSMGGRGGKRGLADSGRELVREYGGDAVLQQFEQAFALPSVKHRDSGSKPKRSHKGTSKPTRAETSTQRLVNGGFLAASTAFVQPGSNMASLARSAGVSEQELRPFFTESGLTDKGYELLGSCNQSTQAAVLWNIQQGLTRRASEQIDAWPSLPENTPVQPADYASPGPSFFEGVSGEYQALGGAHSPGGSYASENNWPSSSGGFDLNVSGYPAGYASPGSSFFEGVSGEYQALGGAHSPGGSYASENNWPSSSGGFDLNASGYPAGYASPEPQTPASYLSSVPSQFSMGDLGDYFNSTASYPQTPIPPDLFGTSYPYPGFSQTHTPPEIVDVDSYPSPQAATQTVAERLAEDRWLRDNDFVNYTQVIAQQIQQSYGQSRAERLNFVDPQQVRLLVEGNERQRDAVLARLAGSPILFLPVNDDNRHWSLLVVNRATRQAFHYDSMVSPQRAYHATNTDQFKVARQVAHALGVKPPLGRPIAKQPDTWSCGDHVLTGIAVLAHRVLGDENFQSVDMDLGEIRPNREHIVGVLTQVEQFYAATHAAPAPQQPRDKKTKRRKNGGS